MVWRNVESGGYGEGLKLLSHARALVLLATCRSLPLVLLQYALASSVKLCLWVRTYFDIFSKSYTDPPSNDDLCRLFPAVLVELEECERRFPVLLFLVSWTSTAGAVGLG